MLSKLLKVSVLTLLAYLLQADHGGVPVHLGHRAQPRPGDHRRGDGRPGAKIHVSDVPCRGVSAGDHAADAGLSGADPLPGVLHAGRAGLLRQERTPAFEEERAAGRRARQWNPHIRTPLCAALSTAVFEGVNLIYVYLSGVALDGGHFGRGTGVRAVYRGHRGGDPIPDPVVAGGCTNLRKRGSFRSAEKTGAAGLRTVEKPMVLERAAFLASFGRSQRSRKMLRHKALGRRKEACALWALGPEGAKATWRRGSETSGGRGQRPPRRLSDRESAPNPGRREGKRVPCGHLGRRPKATRSAPEGSVSPVGCCAKRKATRRCEQIQGAARGQRAERRYLRGQRNHERDR